MITSSSEQLAGDEHPSKDVSSRPVETQDDEAIITSHAQLASATQLLIRGKFISHHPKSGVNPLVDAGSYLFSITGRLKLIKSYRHLNKLHQELVTEINNFQDVAKSHGYSSEYILVSRYALCATLDDVITNTSWGAQGQWDNYSLLTAFNQESNQQERFFIILERLIKDPGIYIDLMEFMYLCLSLGFKGSYRSTEFSSNQHDLICNALYKRIRAHHGDFNKTLSPFPIKPAPLVTAPPQKKPPIGFVIIITASIILSLFIGLGYLLDTISNQAYQELMHIGKSILYETHDT
ncbi:MAG: type IVB secretion system protein IcmH/DotU [Gammaproteobacteria bacterium]